MSNFDDIMNLLGPSVPSYSGPGLEEISRPLPPAVQDTTGDADVWLPTSVAAHYKEYDRFGPAVDELEALIARDGLLTPIRISTDGREAVVHEGNHRLQVAQRLGISEVPAIVTFDSPVFSNGGRVTPLEPVLGSWVEQNRGSLRSFWGHRTASDYSSDFAAAGLPVPQGGPQQRTASPFPYHDTYTQPFLPGHDWPIYLYRGMALNLPSGLENELDIAIMEADQGMIYQVGDRVLDMIGNIGRHWTTEPDVAVDFAHMNRSAGNLIIVISAVWERKGEDFAEEHVGWDGVTRPSNLADEFEVTLTPGTQVRLLSVKARRVLDGQTIERDWEIELLGSPQMRTATWQPWQGDDQEEAQEIAPGTTIYRGMKVVLSDADLEQIRRWQQMPLVQEEIGQHFNIGPFLLDRLEPLGIHWTTKRRIAEIGAMQGGGYGGSGIIIEAEYNGGQDLRGTAYHNDRWSIEEEITMLPGAQVRITGVFLTGIHERKNLLRGPELRTAHTAASSPGTLYRGLAVPFSEAQIEDVMEVYGKDSFVGRVLGYLSRGFFTPNREWGLGKHWTTNINVAKSFSQNGFGTPVVLVADWDGSGEDPYNAPGNNFGGEDEVTLLPETELRLVDILWGPTFESIGGSGRTITAGTRTDPGGVYRGINVQVLNHDEQQELAEWANANAFSLYNYQLAEPNYELVYRILDRLDPGGLGRHWSKDYDVSADFARDQGDGIELILIGHWEGEGVDTREFHRGYDDVLRPSNLPHEEEVTLYPGTPVTLVGMDIVTDTGFTYNIPVPNIQVTAGHDMKHLANRTAASDLRVHLFDSEGHEMWLEPDFDSNPWTYHPKVMDAVRFLADVAQEDGVYWHMDHNEFIPSTITDFKVFDGSNDVTHEIKEFPQLRGRYASRTAYVSDDIYESYYDTDRLVYLVMNVYVWGTDQPLWELVANSPEGAQAFFDSLDEDERRWNAAEVLENGGWTMSAIGRKFSTRTAAEPGGVLPWNPSHRGYTWITHSDGTLEAVTNDAVNRMFLTEEPWGWEWEVYDSLGFVEGGTFGMALKGGDALRQRANELLAEFDTRAEMRTRGPSRGYQDDYTPAPNTLWSKRKTTSQRYAERLRREGRR